MNDAYKELVRMATCGRYAMLMVKRGLMDVDFEAMLTDRVARLQNAHRLPSLTVAVTQCDALLAAASAGFADVEKALPATVDSVYRIGSITKTFTAALTLLLVQQGELQLDSPVDRYLTGTSFGQVPLRMLLAHRAGIQREVPVDMWESMRGPSRTELLEAFSRVEMVADAGQRWHYSNLGYAAIGAIIERVTGCSCEQLIERTLLAPLGLRYTTWEPPPDAVVGYRIDPFVDTVHPEPVMDQAAIAVAGQLWSTPTDLLRWGNTLAGTEPQILPPPVVEAMHTLQVMVDTKTWTRAWGLGLILDRRGNRILAGHTGAMPGFQSALTIDRDAGTVVVACVNATRGITLTDLTAEIACQAAEQRAAAPTPTWQPAPPCPDGIRDVLGSWWSEADETIFTWRHDGLHAHLAADPPNTDTRFAAEASGRYRAIEGRLQGELLTIADTATGLQLHWATYPFTRSPR
jgi:CubicO group peptidase (beta-lactamase class C family)